LYIYTWWKSDNNLYIVYRVQNNYDIFLLLLQMIFTSPIYIPHLWDYLQNHIVAQRTQSASLYLSSSPPAPPPPPTCSLGDVYFIIHRLHFPLQYNGNLEGFTYINYTTCLCTADRSHSSNSLFIPPCIKEEAERESVAVAGVLWKLSRKWERGRGGGDRERDWETNRQQTNRWTDRLTDILNSGNRQTKSEMYTRKWKWRHMLRIWSPDTLK